MNSPAITGNPIVISLLAGIAGGLMVLAAFNAGLLAFFLMFAAPATVYIASMGWGTVAGIIAAGVATAMAAIFASGTFAVLSGLLLFAPAAWVGHLTNLAQPREDGNGIVWYPLSAILLRLMAALAIGFIIVGWLSGYSSEMFVSSFVELMKQMAAENPDLGQIDETRLMDQAASYATLLPIIVPCVWLLCHVLTAFISAAITRRSGVLARQPEDVAATADLPFEAAGFMAAGLIGALLLSGAPSYAGGVFLGLAIGGYGLIGLAQLHLRVRGNPAGGLIISTAYALIVLFTIPLFIFTVMGLIRSFSQNKPGTPGGGPSNPV